MNWLWRWIRCSWCDFHKWERLGSHPSHILPVGGKQGDLPLGARTTLLFYCGLCGRYKSQTVDGFWEWPGQPQKTDVELNQLRRMAGLK